MLTPEQIIEQLGLEPLPVEGGLFTQTYLSPERLPQDCLPDRYPGDKAFGTAILYLLTADPDSFSALHKLPTDEIYHFHMGDPVELLQLHPDGTGERVVLGHDILNGQKVQHVVRRDVWQGSRLLPGGKWALIGTTMAPGFSNEDYCGGDRDELVARYPEQADLVLGLTRPHAPFRRMS